MKYLILLFFLISNCNLALSQINNTESLVNAIYKRYHGKVNQNISFIQVNSYYKADGTKEIETAFEAFHFPGKFRLDIGPGINHNGYIQKEDSIYSFENGKLSVRKKQAHEMILFYGDMFFIKPEITLERLKNLGYDLSKFREDNFKGESVYVIGANKGDNISKQFWIDKDDFFLVRQIGVENELGQKEDIQYFEHEIVGKTWIESKIKVFINGILLREEHYTEVNADDANLDLKVFEPSHLGKAHWHKK